MAEYCDEFVLEQALSGEFNVREVVTENGIPKGGTADQFLKKKSSENFDAEWSNIEAGAVGYDPEKTYDSGSVGAVISDVKIDLITHPDVVWITDTDSTLQGITVKRITENTAVLYGTSTASNIRYHAIFNRNERGIITSTTNPEKVFPAGTYTLEYSSSGAAPLDDSRIYIAIVTTTGATALLISNHQTFTSTSSFTIALRIPAYQNMGTNVSPTYLNIHLYKTEYRRGNVLAPSNDTTDRAAEIAMILNDYRVCYLQHGYYYVSGIDMPDNTTLIGCGIGTKIVLLDSVISGSAIKMGSRCAVKNCEIIGSLDQLSFEYGEIDSINIGTRHGILWKGEAPSTAESENNRHFEGLITGCYIRRFTGGAITCEATGYSYLAGVTVSDCEIYNCGSGINVSWFSEYNRFCNINVIGCYYGCINNGGNNSFASCNFSGNHVGFYNNGADGKCVLSDGTTANLVNGGHGQAVGCIINHSGLGSDVNNGYAVYIRNVNPGWIFSGCQFFYGRIYLRSAQNVMFANTNLGSGIILVIYGTTGTSIFSMCYVRDTIVAYVYDTDDTIIPASSYTYDTENGEANLQKAKFLNVYSFTGTKYTLKFVSSDTPESAS